MPDFMNSAVKPLSQHSDGGDRTVGMLSSSPVTAALIRGAGSCLKVVRKLEALESDFVVLWLCDRPGLLCCCRNHSK